MSVSLLLGVPGKIKTLLNRLTDQRAQNLDLLANLSGGYISNYDVASLKQYVNNNRSFSTDITNNRNGAAIWGKYKPGVQVDVVTYTGPLALSKLSVNMSASKGSYNGSGSRSVKADMKCNVSILIDNTNVINKNVSTKKVYHTLHVTNKYTPGAESLTLGNFPSPILVKNSLVVKLEVLQYSGIRVGTLGVSTVYVWPSQSFSVLINAVKL